MKGVSSIFPLEMISIRKLNNPSSYQMQLPSELSLSREWKLELVQIFSKESSEKVGKGRECEERGEGKILKFPVRRIPSVQEAYRSSGNHLDRQKPVLRLCTSSKDPLSRFRGTGANQPLEIDFFSQRVQRATIKVSRRTRLYETISFSSPAGLSMELGETGIKTMVLPVVGELGFSLSLSKSLEGAHLRYVDRLVRTTRRKFHGSDFRVHGLNRRCTLCFKW